MFTKIMILLMTLLILAGIGYYILEKEGAFQTKEEIYSNMPAMKCEAGKCGGAMEKPAAKKCVAGGKCAAGKCGNQ